MRCIINKPLLRALRIFFILCLTVLISPSYGASLREDTLNYPIVTSITPKKVYQGDIFKLTIDAPPDMVIKKVRFLKKDYPVAGVAMGRGDENPKNTSWVILGAPISTPHGKRLIVIKGTYRDGRKFIKNIPIVINKKQFPEEHLTVPEKMVEFPTRILKRVRADQRAIKTAVSAVTPRPLFNGPFLMPVDDIIKSEFGLRRFFNGRPRSPHSGVDIRAKTGEPISATNSGRVVLVRNCYLSGNTVVIDHGLGLYSIYAHLNSVRVKQGEIVKKGDIIGAAGMTGRATGPHLHWGASLLGERLNPLTLLKLF